MRYSNAETKEKKKKKKVIMCTANLRSPLLYAPLNFTGRWSNSSIQSVSFAESVFTPKDIDLEDGEMDDAERELEAFKRFCLQSVPPPRKEKVNLNIKDIVLKKKSSSSSSSSSAAAAVIAAN